MGQDYVRLKDGYKKGPQKVICDNYCKHVLKQTLYLLVVVVQYLGNDNPDGE